MSGRRFEVTLPDGVSRESLDAFLRAASNLGADVKAVASKLEAPLYAKREVVLGVLQLDNHTLEEKEAILKKAGFHIAPSEIDALLSSCKKNDKIDTIDWFQIFYAPHNASSKEVRDYDHSFYQALATQVSRLKARNEQVPETVLKFFERASSSPAPQP